MLKSFITFLLLVITFQKEETPAGDFSDPLNLQTPKLNNIIDSIFDSNECLMSTKEAQKILENDYSIYSSQIDDNIKFILGKCNPVLFVPGIYATKLTLRIDCKNFKNENKDRYMEMRVFCGDSICKDNKNIEEHPLFISLTDKPTAILNRDSNKYSACLGFFMQFYNNKDECPVTDDSKKVCYYSPYVEIGFYGSSSTLYTKSRCGLSAIQNVIQTGSVYLDAIINQGAPKVYKNMINRLKEMGYRDGFSYAGLPYDYRRFLYKNKFAIKAFKYQIEKMYKNTGKKVIIVAHSYGTLLTLNNLVGENKDLSSKIKKFIAIGGPFAGSSKLLDVFLHGMTAWDVNINFADEKIKLISYNPYGQHIMYKALPTIMELRPLPILKQLFNDPQYKDFAEAIKERLNLEKVCKRNKKTCTKDYINKNNVKFKNIFKDSFPDLASNDCKLTSSLYQTLRRSKYDMFDSVCMTEMFLPSQCPMVLKKSSIFNPKLTTSESVEKLCGIKNASLYYVSDDCENDNCVDKIYLNEFTYPFTNKEKTQFFIDRFNKEFSKEFGKKIDMSYFEKKDSFQNKYKELIENHKRYSITQKLPIPPVDTDVVYTTFNPTKSIFLYNKNNMESFDDYYGYGGDDTVPNWSSLLTGFKWLYDKKKNNLKQEIKLVEYCSKLGRNSEFQFNKNNQKTFSAIWCDCLKYDGNYEKNVKACSHAAMISDSHLIYYVEKNVYRENEKIVKTKEKQNAIENYDPNENYVAICNYDLRKIFVSDMS